MSCCPKDGGELASNDVAGYRYWSCERCAGFWIPGKVLHRALAQEAAKAFETLVGPGLGDAVCPDCGINCDPLGIDDCHVDRCPRCRGVWLDSGEVVRLRRLFPEGSPVVIADDRVPPGGGGKWQVVGDGVGSVGELILILLKAF